MIQARGWTHKTVFILGLARSGSASVRALVAGGAHVFAWDTHKTLRDQAALDGAEIKDPDQVNWVEVQGLLLSPGIPHLPAQAPQAVQRALETGVSLLSDIDLLYGAVQQPFIGVTGTNGKSTTTALMGHLLKTAQIPCQVGGNIGTAALDLEPFEGDGYYVLELSSYQLERLTETRFESAIIINIRPDHLDRHGGMEGYIRAKEHIFHHAHTKILGIDEDYTQALAPKYPDALKVSCHQETPLHVKDGILVDHGQEIIDLKQTPALFAAHNWQNSLSAYAGLAFLKIPPQRLVEGFMTFPGLAHRQEKVEEHKGITFINDSKATNMDSALQALKAYGNIHWIVGGVPKGDDYAQALPYKSHIDHVYAIGEARSLIAETLSSDLPTESFEHMEQALEKAYGQAPQGATILLSPACASFDQFKDFEARGQHFKTLVRRLVR